MGCTNESAFPLSNSTYVQNLSTVFSPQNIPVTIGWNTFQFTNTNGMVFHLVAVNEIGQILEKYFCGKPADLILRPEKIFYGFTFI